MSLPQSIILKTITMANKNPTTAAAKKKVVLLKNKIPTAMAAQVATSKENAKVAKDKKAAYSNQDKTLVKIEEPICGKFNLPYKVGQEVEMETKQAYELVVLKFASLVSEGDTISSLQKKLGIKNED
jgi:hypothetical protein